MMKVLIGVLAALLGVSCSKQVPQRVENANLGITATFPSKTRLTKFEESTPFGRMEWFDIVCALGPRMDESFRVAVGNLPSGKRGGTTPGEVLRTFQQWQEKRFGPLVWTPLSGGMTPGFHYKGAGPQGSSLEGVVVCRRGRLHHAQAMVRKADDPRLRALIDGFVVAP